MIVSRLAHVALAVPDPDAATDFYGDVFGLAVVDDRDGWRYLSSGRSRTFELALTAGEAQLDHFAFSACGADALALARERLGDAGVPFVEVDPEPGIAEGIELALPTGHAMRLVVERDPVPFVVSALAPPRNHLGVGPVPIEHVTLHAYDIRANAEMLVDLLGFRISESIRPANAPRWRNTFLRAGQMHHDLGLIPTDQDRPGLHHFCFEVPSVAELIAMSDALASRGMQLDSSLGRHVSGNNVFLYFKDPFGHRLEVNTDMARVDAAAPPLVRDAPAPFDAWRPGRPPALEAGTPARDLRVPASNRPQEG
jgi:catechol 2,3-dioxygenase